ncbi:COP9 signalosome complex subunit 7b isoform X2 [Lepisosteus oculatus]|uniref:COP9 signalosome complex subunit 7b isoform X2 n=1 Tax=Lepisosteus oculatus TaxID=7918 RepID=UPI0003EA9471|nr:PREDICTED: COP9 signalosome complex subunit 7b isoform X2 [Lepisosteus oculatus]
MAGELKCPSSSLEQFILLARNTKGSALIALINQVLEAPGVYVFGELLDLPCVQELSEGPNKGYFQLLNVFAYGTYLDYIANKETLPTLTHTQQNKLKHLTIVNLAARMQSIPYSVLLKDLEIKNLRELEDLIIEAVYTDVIRGKLDQRRQLLEVDLCVSRDIQARNISSIVDTLQQWCSSCESVTSAIELQINRVNLCRKNHLRAQQRSETEVSNIKKTLKATALPSSQEMDSSSLDWEGSQPSDQRPLSKMMSKTKGPVQH